MDVTSNWWFPCLFKTKSYSKRCKLPYQTNGFHASNTHYPVSIHNRYYIQKSVQCSIRSTFICQEIIKRNQFAFIVHGRNPKMFHKVLNDADAQNKTALSSPLSIKASCSFNIICRNLRPNILLMREVDILLFDFLCQINGCLLHPSILSNQ